MDRQRTDVRQTNRGLRHRRTVEHDRDANGGGRVVAELAIDLLVRRSLARLGYRDARLDQNLIGTQLGLEHRGLKIDRAVHHSAVRTHRMQFGTKHHGNRRPIARRVAVRNRATERAAVAGQRIGKALRSVEDHRIAIADQLGALELPMADECADPQHAVGLFERVESNDVVDIDDQVRACKPEFEHRQKTLAPGHNLGVDSTRDESLHGLVNRGRGDIFETAW